MKRKTIFTVLAAMALIVFSCTGEDTYNRPGEIDPAGEVTTRSGYPPKDFYCHLCGFWTIQDGACHSCGAKYIHCQICGNTAPGQGSVCYTCSGHNPHIDWIDNDDDIGPKP